MSRLRFTKFIVEVSTVKEELDIHDRSLEIKFH